MPVHLPAFVVTTWLLAMLPGAGQALMIRQTLGAGRRGAWACIAGVATGFMIWSTTAAAGLSAILLSSPAAYGVIRIIGGVVLFGLGISTLMALRRTVAPAAAADRTAGGRRHERSGGRREGRPDALHKGRPDGPREGRWGGYAAGLATSLGNPKVGVFAVSVLPQFVTEHGPVFLSSVALGAIWTLVTVTWYTLLTWGVDKGRNLVSRPAVHRRLQMLTGTVLVLLGVAVATGV